MVSNARDDFPEPDSPVNTISWSRGRSSVTFLRLCSRAPWMTSLSEPTGRVYRRAATRPNGVAGRTFDRLAAYPGPMDRDLRSSPLYQEIEEHFRKVYEPGF